MQRGGYLLQRILIEYHLAALVLLPAVNVQAYAAVNAALAAGYQSIC